MEQKTVAVLSVALESCVSNPKLFEFSDFHYMHGADYAAHEKGVFVERLRGLDPDLFKGVSVAHTGCWRGMAGGAVEAGSWERLLSAAADALAAAGPSVAAVFLDLHGAMSAEGSRDAERDLVRRLRGVCGEDTLFAASFDLHANVSADLVELLNVVAAYRTMPHVDHQDTQVKALSALLRAVRETRRPVAVHVRVPLCVQGDRLPTTVVVGGDVQPAQPGSALWGEAIDEAERHPGVLVCAVLAGNPYADEERVGASVVVTGYGDGLRAVAEAVARQFWRCRSDIRLHPSTPLLPDAEAVSVALAAPGTTIVSDIGDNIGAGSTGDVPHMLRLLLSSTPPAARAIVGGLLDAGAVSAAASSGTVEVEVGNSVLASGAEWAQPVRVRATVVRVGGGEGWPPPFAVLSAGWVTVIVTARKWGFFGPADFRLAGITDKDLAAADLVVVKLGLASADLLSAASPSSNVLADSPGPSSMDIDSAAGVERRHLVRPMWPMDADTPDPDWF